VRTEYVNDQLDAGLDRVVEGQGRWDDMIAHPLTVHDSVETGGIVRYYDNNNFYRDPRVVDDLDFSGDVARELERATDLIDGEAPLAATLPGPYSLADLATDEHYGDEAAFQAAIAEFLAGEVEAFPAHETLFLLEPSLVTNPPAEGEESTATDAIATVADATDADVVVQTSYGALDEKLYAHLVDEASATRGLDLVAGDRDDDTCVQRSGVRRHRLTRARGSSTGRTRSLRSRRRSRSASSGSSRRSPLKGSTGPT